MARPRKNRTLNYDERRCIAENIRDGMIVKQAAAKWMISVPYAYEIFKEFLVWKAEWKMKE